MPEPDGRDRHKQSPAGKNDDPRGEFGMSGHPWAKAVRRNAFPPHREQQCERQYAVYDQQQEHTGETNPRTGLAR
jgi:hypothetical protein